MKERPILFSGEMVRAILAGRKTQTRRIMRMTDEARLELSSPLAHVDPQYGVFEHSSGANVRIAVPGAGYWAHCPYGNVGDRLWVRETWYDDLDRESGDIPERLDDGRVAGIEYRASHNCANFEAGCPCNPDGDGNRSEWRPSIFMPRWASRLTLEVVEIRVERLQDITEDDARAEGVTPFPYDPEGDCWTDGKHRTAFEHLWGKINGERAPWASNCWVWVVSFRRLEKEGPNA